MEQECSHVQTPNFNNYTPMRSAPPNLISYSASNNLSPFRGSGSGSGSGNSNGNGNIQLFFSYYRSNPSNFVQPQTLPLGYSQFMYNPYLSPSPRFGFSEAPVEGWINGSRSQLGMTGNSEYSGETSRAMNKSVYRQSTVQVTDPAARRINLPIDVITEILRRLPAKEILRIRSICKLWNSLTRENQFISQHMNNPPNPDDLGIITLYQSHNLMKFKFFMHCFVNGFDEFNMIDLYELGEDSFQMSNSCRGLVCIYGRFSTYVVNPSIKEVLEVPRTENRAQASIALVHDESSGKYKLIRLFELAVRDRTGCEIFELGSYCWRAAPDALSSVKYNSLPVVVNGAIYWVANLALRDATIVISLDIKSERFNIIDEPMDFADRWNAQIFELDGQLCLSTMTESARQLTLWTLSDDGGEECCRWGMHVFSSNQSSEGDYNPFRTVVPVTCRAGKILWQGCCGRYECYDLKAEEFLGPIYIEHEYTLGQVCAYIESLISPAEIQSGNQGRQFEQVPWPI